MSYDEEEIKDDLFAPEEAEDLDTETDLDDALLEDDLMADMDDEEGLDEEFTNPEDSML